MPQEQQNTQNRRPLLLCLCLMPVALLLGIALSNHNSTIPYSPDPLIRPLQQPTPTEHDPYREMYVDSDTQTFQTERLSFTTLGGSNTVICWPSVGGLIIADRVTPIELQYLSLPRFTSTPRSLNQTAEDEFCRQLRKIGGKWFPSHWDWWAKYVQMSRDMKLSEMEVLTLGWPEVGGVWVLRRPSRWGEDRGWSLRIRNAVTMKERCEAIEMSGGVFYARPEENVFVKALLEGFGEKGRFDDDWALPDGYEDEKRLKGQKM